MGIVYERSDDKSGLLKGGWTVEARTRSIIIYNQDDISSEIEVNYVDLDNLQAAVEFAQQVRRDRKRAGQEER